MKKSTFALATLGGLLCLYSASALSETHSASPIAKMSKEQLIKLAMSAAPASISQDATIMIPGPDGKLVEAKKGTNGFTCLPDIDGQEKPDPICADGPSMQWAGDYMNGAQKPSNTVPGISYMGKGGWHWEKDGKIMLHNSGGEGMKDAKRVSEPPHWMLFWPIESKASGIPVLPNKWGTYVMFEGTPYAHLMIYQDPMKIK